MPHPVKATRTFFVNVASTSPATELTGADPNTIEIDVANIDPVNAINLVGEGSQGADEGFPIDAGQKLILTEVDGDDVKKGLLAIADNATVTLRMRVVTIREDS